MHAAEGTVEASGRQLLLELQMDEGVANGELAAWLTVETGES